jgi:ribosomal protein S18 acetylase RimI-like enzyme
MFIETHETLDEAYRILHSYNKPRLSRWDAERWVAANAEANEPIEWNGPYFKAVPRRFRPTAAEQVPAKYDLFYNDDDFINDNYHATAAEQLQAEYGLIYNDDGFIDNDYYENPMPDVDARTENVKKLLEEGTLDLGAYHADPPLHFEFVRSATELEDADLEACFNLIEHTSGDDYKASSIGWKPKKKKEEMKDKAMMYLLLKQGDSGSGALVGFISFMITTDDPPHQREEVVYIYEVHLDDSLRGRGLGSRLIRFVEEATLRCGILKTMLTVFKSNAGAKGLYEKLGYSKDDCSPEDKVVRRRIIEAEYLIMSRLLY